MTIKDAKILVLNYFKDSQQLFENKIPDLLLVSENKLLDIKIIEAALQDLIEAKIVKCLEMEFEGKKNKSTRIWVLTQPLSAYPQTIELSSSLVMEIANIVNTYCEVNKIDERVDPFNITEKDIISLLLLYKEANNIVLKSIENAKRQNTNPS